MSLLRLVVLTAFCGWAVGSNPVLADEQSQEPTTADILAHPEVEGALRAIDAWLEGVHIYTRLPGISAGIVHDQDLIWHRGWGYSNLEEKRPADADTIYSICSISKPFTAIAVMQLRDANELTLRDAVRDHLDNFEINQAFPDSGPITIESLLTHTSGIRRNTGLRFWSGPEFPTPTVSAMMEKLKTMSTLHPAQHRYHYSNMAFALAGQIVEQRSGQEYQAYMRENILAPLGLSSTRPYYPLELRGDQLAIGYAGMGRSGIRAPLEPFDTGALTPAAGLTSSVNDLGKFASWQFRLLEDGGEEVLNVHTLREMYRIHWVDPDRKASYGIGFRVKQLAGLTTVGHSGDCPGYISDLSMIPDQTLASIVLMNAGDAPAGRVSRSVLKVMSAALKVATTASEEAMPDFSMYEGNYHALYSGYGGEQAIRQWGHQLVSIIMPSDDLADAMTRLEPDGGHKFLSVKKNEELQDSWVFEMGDDGKAARIFQDDTYWYRIDGTPATPGGDVVGNSGPLSPR